MKQGRPRVIHYLAAAVGLTALVISSSAVAAGIQGSIHDFSGRSYTGGTGSLGTGEICVVCHAPHNNNNAQGTLLWNHTQLGVTNFTLYDSSTLQASGGTLGQPTGVSKLCLSCHDGTIAVDSFGGSKGGGHSPQYVSGQFAVGGDAAGLSNDHPISFVYNTALATADGALFDPSDSGHQVIVGDVGFGGKTKQGTIAEVMLVNGQVQCSSCHDVHNNYTQAVNLLKVTDVGSKICLTCHNK